MVLEKGGEDQLDQSCEKEQVLMHVESRKRTEEYPTNSKTKEG